jgi:hypothetical protein
MALFPMSGVLRGFLQARGIAKIGKDIVENSRF